MVGSGMFNGLMETFVALLVIAVVSVVAWIGYGAYCLFWDDDRVEVISSRPIVPEIRYATDGKKIDTLYVYALPINNK